MFYNMDGLWSLYNYMGLLSIPQMILSVMKLNWISFSFITNIIIYHYFGTYHVTVFCYMLTAQAQQNFVNILVCNNRWSYQKYRTEP